MIERKLTETDVALLDSYRFKCNSVKDFTKSCIVGTNTGLFLFGAGGTGKSYGIRETFNEQRMRHIEPQDVHAASHDDDDDEQGGGNVTDFKFDSWIEHLGRISAKGLVAKLAQFPYSVHLIEDAETLFDNKDCWGVLRMCLESQSHDFHSKRHVTWVISTAKGSYDFYFYGSIIIVGNRKPSDKLGDIEATKTRATILDFNVADLEIIAKMKEICIKGFNVSGIKLSPDDCFDVLDFLLSHQSFVKRMNLRVLISGFKRLVFNRIDPTVNWRAMLEEEIKEEAGSSKLRRKDRIHDEKKIATDLAIRAKKEHMTQEAKLVAWCKAVNKDSDWSNYPKDSQEYIRGFGSAKSDFQRKVK